MKVSTEDEINEKNWDCISKAQKVEELKQRNFEESETDQAIDVGFDVKTVLSINALAQIGLLVVLPVLFQYCIMVTKSL